MPALSANMSTAQETCRRRQRRSRSSNVMRCRSSPQVPWLCTARRCATHDAPQRRSFRRVRPGGRAAPSPAASLASCAPTRDTLAYDARRTHDHSRWLGPPSNEPIPACTAHGAHMLSDTPCQRPPLRHSDWKCLARVNRERPAEYCDCEELACWRQEYVNEHSFLDLSVVPEPRRCLTSLRCCKFVG